MRSQLLLTAFSLLAVSPSLHAATEARLVLHPPGVERNDFRPPVMTAVAISPDGRRVAAAGDDHRLLVWDVETGRQIAELEGHADWVRAARFTPDASRLATVAADRSVCLWSLVGSGGELATRRLAGGALHSVAWHPTGTKIVTAGFGDAMRVFDLTADADEEPKTYPCSCEDTRTVVFSPDGRWLASAGRNGVVRVIDLVASGGPRDLPSDGRRVRALAFSPDGETLAAGGDGPAIRLWRMEDDMATPDELLVRPGKVHALTFVDNDLLAVGDTRNDVRVWNTDTRSPRLALRGHTGTVAALAVSADGRRLVSGSFDTTVRVWDLDQAGLPLARVTKQPGDATTKR
ncbi:MAG: WD40 repeat domain-containing protein [Planctomycetota bacterium]